MTTCAEARAAMRDAPPAELRPGPGSPDSPLTQHLEECAACRRLAGRLVAGDEVLDRMLASLAREAAAGDRRGAPRRKVARWAAGLAAGAAAAIMAGMLLAPGHVRMNPSWQPAASHLAPATEVQVADADGAVAVFVSPEHAVTVVWLNPDVSLGTDSEQREENHQ